MYVLIPDSLRETLTPLVAKISPDIALVPYAESGPAPADAGKASAILRWVAGHRYAQLIEDNPEIRWLHTASAGLDHVITPVMRERGITITDSGPTFEIPIPEFVLTWILMTAHRMRELIAQQAAREWHSLVQTEVSGATVGIVGLGPIGQGIAARCKALGMRTLGYRRHQAPAQHVDEVLTGPDGLTRLLAESQWVVLAAALTDDSRNLIGAEQLAMMRRDSWLINIARGGLVDESALIDSLRTGAIAGACLDVFAKEPLPLESPLWDMQNVYISPHNSSGMSKALERRQRDAFLENLGRFYRGEPLANAADLSRGY